MVAASYTPLCFILCLGLDLELREVRGDPSVKTLPPTPPISGGHSTIAAVVGVRAGGGCPLARPVHGRAPPVLTGVFGGVPESGA